MSACGEVIVRVPIIVSTQTTHTAIILWSQFDVYSCFSVPYEHQAIFGLDHQVKPHGSHLVGNLLSSVSANNLEGSISQSQLIASKEKLDRLGASGAGGSAGNVFSDDSESAGGAVAEVLNKAVFAVSTKDVSFVIKRSVMSVSIDAACGTALVCGASPSSVLAGTCITVNLNAFSRLVGVSIMDAGTLVFIDTATVPIRHQSRRTHTARNTPCADAGHVKCVAALLTLCSL